MTRDRSMWTSRAIAISSSMTFATWQMMSVALYPFFSSELGFDLATVIACFSLSSFLNVLSGPFWAARSDRSGRLSVLASGLMGLLLSGAVLVFTLLASNALGPTLTIALLITSRVIHGLTVSSLAPVAQTLLADLAHENSSPTSHLKAMTSHSLSLNCGRLLGPLLVLSFGGRTFTLLMAFFAWTCAFTVFAVWANGSAHPEIPRPGNLETPEWISILRSMKQQRSLAVFLVLALIFTALAESLNSSLSLILAKIFVPNSPFEISSTRIAQALLVCGLIVVATQALTRVFWKPEGHKALAVGGFALLVGTMVYSTAVAPSWIWLGIGLLSIGLALVPPGYMALLTASIREKRRRGLYTGTISSIHGLGYAIGGAMTAFVIRTDPGFLPRFLISVCIGVALMISVILVGRRQVVLAGANQ